MGANDDAWTKVLAVYADQLERDGQFEIDAAELKRIGGREPRLMAKHDFSTARPAPFQELGLNILPVSRRRYVVGRFELFEKFPELNLKVTTASLPFELESLKVINSESLALNAAAASGILEDFLSCGQLTPTVNGRMSSATFVMNNARVDRAQIEIDGGYESAEKLVLVEAKNHVTADFNVRQLYFPYRTFVERIHKDVVPVFMVYSNGIFTLYRYQFRDLRDPASIELVDARRYSLSPSSIDVPLLLRTVEETSIEPEPGIPFLQANRFTRVINLVELLLEEPATKEEISEHYDFDIRQSDYYANAGRLLGLLDLANDTLVATGCARTIFGNPDRDARNLALVRQMAKHRVLHDVLVETLRAGAVPDREGIGKRMADLGLGEATLARRASSVQAWAQWVLDLAGENTLF